MTDGDVRPRDDLDRYAGDCRHGGDAVVDALVRAKLDEMKLHGGDRGGKGERTVVTAFGLLDLNQ